MEENMSKIKSILDDQHTIERFEELSKTEYGNQGQCLAQLINLYEMELGKLHLSDRTADIKNLSDASGQSRRVLCNVIVAQ